MRRLNTADWIFLIILVIGGLNWGLIGLFNFDLVAFLFGVDTLLTNIIYIIVGISALYVLFSLLAKTAQVPKER
ncbi:DUF378 domain-containing protein [Candidatus Parcubacteria bacterium]|nr:MAG: DUF378 domain-containing protein [Candidatus Parcubacteria bacterium]